MAKVFDNHQISNVQIITIRLKGDNYLHWFQSFWLYICGGGKIGYLTDEKNAHTKIDLSFATWDAENSIVMTWLVNSMTEEICSNYVFFYYEGLMGKCQPNVFHLDNQ